MPSALYASAKLHRSLTRALLLSAGCAIVLSPAIALAQQGEGAPQDDIEAADSIDAIVVTAPRSAGSVLSDIPAEQVLTEADIASYGASNATELLAALAVQTGSGRGRSSETIVLVNGRRVSGFGEIRNLPSEAIARVETFPEEVALDYGYDPGSRVINFILKDRFSAITAEGEANGSTAGGRAGQKAQASLLRLNNGARINLTAEYNRASALTEAERGITLTDSAVRTLLPASDNWSIDGTVAGDIAPKTGGSLNLRYQRGTNNGLLGADNDSVPARILETASRNETFHVGTSSDGRLGRWRWTITGNYDRGLARIISERSAASAATGSPAIDQSQSITNTGEADLIVTGSPLSLPAGPVRATFQGGWKGISLTASSQRVSGTVLTDLNRTAWAGSANFDVPVASRKEDSLAFLGDLSLQGRYSVRDVSDFRLLKSWIAGVNWSPVERVDILASWTRDETAPGVSQLGAPVITTPNQTLFDFTRGQTVNVAIISGGNPALLAERKRDFTATLNWRPLAEADLLLSGTFAHIQSRNTTNALPLLTPEIEAAFPDRVVRDASGAIVSVDQRAINFLRSDAKQLRYGINFSRAFGLPARGGGPGGFGGGPGRIGGRPSGSGAAPSGGGSPGGGGGSVGFRPGSRWNISAYHTVKFQDEVTIQSGLASLDLLNGSALGNAGGSSRHSVDFEGGWFSKGIGMRLSGNWSEGSEVRSQAAGAPSAQTLRFSSLFTLNARMFVDLTQQEKLVSAIPFFRNSRLRLAVNNLLGDVRTVRDGNGVVPLRYLPGYLDPAGRTIELSFRKQF